MPVWEQILIVVGAIMLVFLMFFLLSLFLWLYSGRLEKKVSEEFKKLEPFEKSRVEVLKKAWEYVDKKNIGYKREFRVLFKKTYPDVSSEDLIQRRKAKETLDFALLYTRKLLSERGKGEESEELVKEIKAREDEGETSYKKYDKVAVRYNAILSMMFVKFINKFSKKHHKDPAVLF